MPRSWERRREQHRGADFNTLIAAKAGLDLQDILGGTALSVASQEGYLSVVNSLIYARATVDLQRNDGSTPLFMASSSGHEESLSIVKALTSHNADLTLSFTSPNTGRDYTPKMIAEECYQTDRYHRVLQRRREKTGQKTQGPAAPSRANF